MPRAWSSAVGLTLLAAPLAASAEPITAARDPRQAFHAANPCTDVK